MCKRSAFWYLWVGVWASMVVHVVLESPDIIWELSGSESAMLKQHPGDSELSIRTGRFYINVYLIFSSPLCLSSLLYDNLCLSSSMFAKFSCIVPRRRLPRSQQAHHQQWKSL